MIRQVYCLGLIWGLSAMEDRKSSKTLDQSPSFLLPFPMVPGTAGFTLNGKGGKSQVGVTNSAQMPFVLGTSFHRGQRRFSEEAFSWNRSFFALSFICTCLICLLIFAPLCFHDGNTIIVSSAAILELCVLSIQKVNI